MWTKYNVSTGTTIEMVDAYRLPDVRTEHGATSSELFIVYFLLSQKLRDGFTQALNRVRDFSRFFMEVSSRFLGLKQFFFQRWPIPPGGQTA